MLTQKQIDKLSWLLDRIDGRQKARDAGMAKIRAALKKRQDRLDNPSLMSPPDCEDEQALVDAILEEIAIENNDLGDKWIAYDIAVDDLHNCQNS